MSFGSLGTYKQFAGITSTDSDEQLDALLRMASEAVETYCNRRFSATTYTEYYDGDGRPDLLLRQRPVLSDVAPLVYLDNTGYYGQASSAFASATELTQGTDFVVVYDDSLPTSTATTYPRGATGRLRWLGGRASQGFWPTRTAGVLTPGIVPTGWPSGDGNIKAVYKAGYTTIPSDLELGTYKFVQQLTAETLASGFSSTGGGVGPYRFTKGQLQGILNGPMPARIGFAHVLAHYRGVTF